MKKAHELHELHELQKSVIGKISNPDLKEKISLEYAKAALRKCHKSAKKTGLSNMTMDEINAEVQAVRDK